MDRKDNTKTIIIEFTNDKFRHLAGLQYLKDIEFASPKAGDVLVMEVK
ncbi:hypothetical protein KII95_09085 [Leuconostoc gelidum subsp. aenigmaticum]|nr:hypothetical protein [Leuconostoc sp.]MBZ5944347.1 hypothetical protein [Leuconostoc gasicomitatum]MBZ6004162.1 hypothetical protein [Leuconostoc gelidum subsp. aenigmaticum]MBZ5950444.1 hypothetical protein [Leuconostoc gasicomitatum]MBZ5950842.1 hypothetical protein [Leuconostoc gasicomitatum]